MPAKTETGVEVRVPLFINEGEIIEVDMRDGSYVNRLKASSQYTLLRNKKGLLVKTGAETPPK